MTILDVIMNIQSDIVKCGICGISGNKNLMTLKEMMKSFDEAGHEVISIIYMCTHCVSHLESKPQKHHLK